MSLPTIEEINIGSREFELHEVRDAMYKVARFLIGHFWGQPSEMANGLGVLLLTWNQAFYRYGQFDFYELEKCITSNMERLTRYKSKNIAEYVEEDRPYIEELFISFLDALTIRKDGRAGRKSPVAAAKALHLLAPHFFPLWDHKISKAYKCNYSHAPVEAYMRFFRLSYDMAGALQSAAQLPTNGKSLLKMIDEYNYAEYTKKWVQ